MNDRRINVPWDEWEVVERIGRGQFGTVYKLSRTKFGITEYAAMKVISIPENPQQIRDDLNFGYDRDSIVVKYKSYLEDIIREYQLLMRVKACPNIIRCDDVSALPHDDGIGWDVFIRMEFLNPCPFMVNRNTTIDETEVIKFGLDICNALSICEKNNILHRDIKPSNILVSELGDYKLGDFGVSRTLENGNTYGTKGIGTYEYMAPEVYKGEKYGKEADIYSLGMVMYWLLNERTFPFMEKGKAPTPRQQENGRLKRFNGEDIPCPSNGSSELKRIVLKALAYDPGDRYKDAEEMIHDLKNLQAAGDVIIVDNTIGVGNDEVASSSITDEGWNDNSATVGKAYNESAGGAVDHSPTVGKRYKKSEDKALKVAEKTSASNPVIRKENKSDIDQKDEDKPHRKKKLVNIIVYCIYPIVFAIVFLTIINNVYTSSAQNQTSTSTTGSRKTLSDVVISENGESENTTLSERYIPELDEETATSIFNDLDIQYNINVAELSSYYFNHDSFSINLYIQGNGSLDNCFMYIICLNESEAMYLYQQLYYSYDFNVSQDYFTGYQDTIQSDNIQYRVLNGYTSSVDDRSYYYHQTIIRSGRCIVLAAAGYHNNVQQIAFSQVDDFVNAFVEYSE